MWRVWIWSLLGELEELVLLLVDDGEREVEFEVERVRRVMSEVEDVGCRDDRRGVGGSLVGSGGERRVDGMVRW